MIQNFRRKLTVLFLASCLGISGILAFFTATDTIVSSFVIGSNDYTIKYDGNGAESGEMEDTTAFLNREISLSKNEYVSTGYSFSSWNTESDGSGRQYGDEEKVENLVDIRY